VTLAKATTPSVGPERRAYGRPRINDLNCDLLSHALRKLPRKDLILLRNQVHVPRYSGSLANHTDIRSTPRHGRLDPQFPS